MSIEGKEITQLPSALPAILRDAEVLKFKMASAPQTGSLLRTLAASKPGGRLLELGTGTGIGTAWLLDGMDATARLETVDNDEAAVAVARTHLSRDPRVTFHLARVPTSSALPRVGTLSLLAPGGVYVIDDLLPQASWPDGHGERVPPLIAALERHADLYCTRLAWSTGVVAAVKRG